MNDRGHNGVSLTRCSPEQARQHAETFQAAAQLPGKRQTATDESADLIVVLAAERAINRSRVGGGVNSGLSRSLAADRVTPSLL